MSNFASPPDELLIDRRDNENKKENQDQSTPADETPSNDIRKQRDTYLKDVMETLRGRGDFHCC